MKIILATALMLFSAASFAGKQPEVPECTKVANFAQSIATINRTGMSESDLQQFVSIPTAQTFPIKLIEHQVYVNNMTPDIAFTTFYNKCVIVGYASMLEVFQHEEDYQNVKHENEVLKSKIANMQAIQYQAALPHYSEPPKATAAHTYGAPIGH